MSVRGYSVDYSVNKTQGGNGTEHVLSHFIPSNEPNLSDVAIKKFLAEMHDTRPELISLFYQHRVVKL